jgi:Fe2+ or Zn2+ uptake regulation protein
MNYPKECELCNSPKIYACDECEQTLSFTCDRCNGIFEVDKQEDDRVYGGIPRRYVKHVD